jgi:hypothetical protein
MSYTSRPKNRQQASLYFHERTADRLISSDIGDCNSTHGVEVHARHGSSDGAGHEKPALLA